MTPPSEASQPFKEPIQAFQQITHQLVTSSGALWTKAAEQSDSKAGLGIDDRIGLVHSLVDIWVKGNAALLQALLDSQKGNAKPRPDPEPSQEVTVASVNYERKLTADTPFVRVGQPAKVLPANKISFKPDVLPAGKTEFTVLVTDYDYLGSNYSGTVKLSPTQTALGNNPALAPSSEAVIVGL